MVRLSSVPKYPGVLEQEQPTYLSERDFFTLLHTKGGHTVTVSPFQPHWNGMLSMSRN